MSEGDVVVDDMEELYRVVDLFVNLRDRLPSGEGLAAADTGAVVGVLLALSRLAVVGKERIAQLDINPLFVSERGAVAADALVVLRAAAVGAGRAVPVSFEAVPA